MEDADRTLAGDATLAGPNPERTLPEARDLERPLRRGDEVGRYVVLGKLGAGGMGIVHAAYDPELDRKIALKLLLPGPGGSLATTDGRSRLLREAQAMAKLSHPNVVAVHDVGLHGERVFLAMEFVEGQTLGAWLKQVPRSWREILEVFRAAGRGLAAAHEAGLIHRDFKPDNVMIETRGGVKVMDFGLARAQAKGESSPGAELSTDGADIEVLATRDPELSQELTRAGAIMGTPAYMAPEQHLAADTDAKTDQFSFCVALYEALYGERPFKGGSLAALAAAVTRGKIQDAPRGANVPAWIRKILLRGLSVAPSDRWPSMDALLQELGRDPAAGRRRLAGVGVAALALAGGIYGWQSSRASQADVCADMERHLEGVWDEEARAEVERAMLDTGVDYADATWERVRGRLDAYAQAWVDQRREACEATRVTGEQSGTMMDLRMACLDGRMRRLRAAVEVLESADAKLVPRAIQLVAGLPSLQRCADTEALSAAVPPPEDPEVAQKVDELDQRLAHAHALEYAGRYPEALELAAKATEEAENTGYTPIVARALSKRGRLEGRMGQLDASAATLERAMAYAIEHHLEDVATDVSSHLVYLAGHQRVRYDEAKRWGTLALAYARATGARDVEAHTHTNLGSAALAAGKHEEAKEQFSIAVEILEETSDEGDPNLASGLDNLGMALNALGELEQAKALHERALALFEATLGPEHPHTATSLNNLGAVARDLGDLAAAREYHERSLALFEKALGPEHPNVGGMVHNVGEIAHDQGQYDDAIAYHERALKIIEASVGPDHVMTAYPLGGLGLDLVDAGRAEEALPHLERAVKIGIAHQLEPAEYAGDQFTLARALWDANRDRARARDLAETARDAFTGKPGEDKRLADIEAWLRERQ